METFKKETLALCDDKDDAHIMQNQTENQNDDETEVDKLTDEEEALDVSMD